MIRLTLRWVHLAWAVGIAAILGFAFWLTAPYTISARAHHVPGVGWVLHSYLQNSVRNRTLLDRVPAHVDLDSDALKQLGAGHYASACALCHGAPGSPRNPVAREMNPAPTDLAHVDYSATEFHWIGYNGFRYSGMPAWAGADRRDELWALAAFLEDYDTLDPEGYRQLAFGETAEQPPQSDESEGFGMPAGELELAESCMRCHGRDGQGRGGTAPVLAGQSQSYLRAALDAYADDARQSGYMEPVAAALDPAERDELARLFADMDGLDAALPEGDSRGARLAAEGDESHDIPACSGCHGSNRKEGWPIIAGQSERWIATWLRLWRETPHGALGQDDKMHAAARHLTDDDIEALAAYYSGGAAD